MNLVLQILSAVGAILILGAFYALQRGWWARHQSSYLWANVVGGVLLFLVAAWDRRIGFMLLEGALAAIAFTALVKRAPGNLPGAERGPP